MFRSFIGLVCVAVGCLVVSVGAPSALADDSGSCWSATSNVVTCSWSGFGYGADGVIVDIYSPSNGMQYLVQGESSASSVVLDDLGSGQWSYTLIPVFYAGGVTLGVCDPAGDVWGLTSAPSYYSCEPSVPSGYFDVSGTSSFGSGGFVSGVDFVDGLRSSDSAPSGSVVDLGDTGGTSCESGAGLVYGFYCPLANWLVSAGDGSPPSSGGGGGGGGSVTVVPPSPSATPGGGSLLSFATEVGDGFGVVFVFGFAVWGLTIPLRFLLKMTGIS